MSAWQTVLRIHAPAVSASVSRRGE